MKDKTKLIRITTVPMSLKTLLKGQMKFMSENGFDVVAVSSPGQDDLDDVKKNERVKTVAVSMTRTISPLKDLTALWKLIRLFQKEKPEIVHTHTPKAGLLGMLAARITGVPLRLHTVAGLPLLVAKGWKRKLLNFTEKTTYACASKVYPNSVGLKKIILDNEFVQPDKLAIIGKGSSNGIDTQEFDPAGVSEDEVVDLRQQLHILPDDFVFIFVGRIVGDKGINELITAFKNVKSSNNKVAKLLLVGPFEAELDPLGAATLKEIESNPNIVCTGFQKKVRPYFALADVLTFPSYREGFPNVVMQAAAMQLNAIVTDINGCNEIIKNGDNGWIIPVKNVDALKDRMEWCLANPEQSKIMGLKSRKMMQDKFERRFVWQELLKEYRKLLQTIPKAAPAET